MTVKNRPNIDEIANLATMLLPSTSCSQRSLSSHSFFIHIHIHTYMLFLQKLIFSAFSFISRFYRLRVLGVMAAASTFNFNFPHPRRYGATRG